MILEIPLPYNALVVEAGCRTPNRLRLVTCVPVEIAEMTSKEAPVVARLTGTALYRAPDESELTTRPIDLGYRRGPGGSIMRPVREDFEQYTAYRPASPALHRDTAQAVLDEWRRAVTLPRAGVNPSPLPKQWDLTLGINRVSDLRREQDSVEARTWVSDDRQQAEARLRQTLAGSAFVNGILHVRSRGPAWVSRHRAEHKPSGTYKLAWCVSAHPEAALLSDTEEQMVFRGDRRDAAFEHGATCAALLRDFVQKSRRKRIFANAVVGDQVEKHGDIVIGDPQVFTYDDDGAALKAAVNRTFERVVPFVGLLGSRSLHDFADLRDRWPGCPIENQLTFARRLDEVLADVTEELVDKTNHLDFAMCNLDGLTPLARWLKVRKPLRHEPEEDPAGNFFRP